jgi:hypothetical protein
MGIGAGSIYSSGGNGSAGDLIKAIAGHEPVAVSLSSDGKQVGISLDPNFTNQVVENKDDIAELQTLAAQAARVAVVDLSGSESQAAITAGFNSYFEIPAQPGDKVFDDNAASGLQTTTWILNNARTWVQIQTGYNLFDANFSGLIRQPPFPQDGNVVAQPGVPGVGTVNGWSDLKASVAAKLPLAGGSMNTGAVIRGNGTANGVANALKLGQNNSDNVLVSGNLYVNKSSDGSANGTLVIENDDASWRGNIANASAGIIRQTGDSAYSKINGTASELVLGDGSLMSLTAASPNTSIALQYNRRVYRLLNNTAYALGGGLYDGHEIIIFCGSDIASNSYLCKLQVSRYKSGASNGAKVGPATLDVGCRFIHLIYDQRNTCWVNVLG